MPISVSEAKRELTPSAKKFLQVINSLPDDKLYDAKEIADLCGWASTNTFHYTLRAIGNLTPYRERQGDPRKFYYGHPKAIAAYRKSR